MEVGTVLILNFKIFEIISLFKCYIYSVQKIKTIVFQQRRWPNRFYKMYSNFILRTGHKFNQIVTTFRIYVILTVIV